MIYSKLSLSRNLPHAIVHYDFKFESSKILFRFPSAFLPTPHRKLIHFITFISYIPTFPTLQDLPNLKRQQFTHHYKVFLFGKFNSLLLTLNNFIKIKQLSVGSKEKQQSNFMIFLNLLSIKSNQGELNKFIYFSMKITSK